MLLLPSLACGDDDGRTGPDTDARGARRDIALHHARWGLARRDRRHPVRLDAEVRDQKGNAITSVTVELGTLDPAVATVDNDGLVTAAAVGTAQIAASTGELGIRPS